MADGSAPARRPGGHDLTSGPILRTLIVFALPTLGSNILQSLNVSINAVWIGRALGEKALAASSNANLVTFLAFAAVFGFGLAATILVGQAMGRRDVDAARRALGTAFGTFAIVSALVAAIGWFAAAPLLRLLATPPEAVPLALAYLRVIFLGVPASFLLVVLSMGLRGTGDSLTPFLVMVLTVVLDAGLNPVLILGLGPAPRLGIAGSALATLFANSVALLVTIVILYARDLPIRLRGAELRYLRPDPALLRIILVKGLPMGLQMFVISFAGLTLMGLVNRAGVDVTAAYGVALQLWTYVQMPALAIGAAVSAMAAQNIGAGRWDRVDAITRGGVLANLALTGALLALLFAVDRPVLALFLGATSPAVEIARHINLVGSWSFLLFGVTIVIFGTVRATGAVVPPLVILFLALFPIRLSVAFAMMPRFGTEALWWTMPLGSLAAMLMAIGYYRFGGWRRARMAVPAAAS
ncbi:MATE family efflux transporter [Sphingomonas morindae]|uniref:MATE family efflux transporter n=1 Tax=Sphingomonas morindae TaxID=1541170 RepID=A0ABY4X711_9SPHN|nr:MATE family efflux transporter [Sphingomonas morindae]USI72684.1 MATE family efflux transporter [Sphingomonas morindae]